MNIDMTRVIRQAQEQGFRYQRTEKNHHQFYAPNGKDIITHSSTGSDVRGDDNFMSDMKRAGYVHGLNSLAEALQAAGAKPPNGGGKLSVTQYLVDALARHPEGLVVPDLKAIINSQRPGLNANATYSGLNTLMVKGFVKKLPSGIYKLTDADLSSFKTSARPARGKTEPHKTTPPKTNGVHKPTVEIGERTGDATIDADLQALDNALAALAQIEGVVRKNREVLAQLASLKKLLGGT
jgi:hypothetical protein